jgi:ABC-type sugar transport system substrate-binding protein
MRSFPTGGRRRGILTLVTLSLAIMLLAPALPSASAATSAASPIKMFMLPKFTGIPPFTQADQGAAQFAKTFGYQLDYGGPTTASATDQVKFIDSSVARGYKGIFISADDPAVVTPALKRAEQNGVTVVSYDSDVLPAGRSVYVQGTSAALIASTQLDTLGSQIGYKGDFVILSAQATDSNQVLWNSIIVQDLKLPKYANMHLVTIINPPDDSTPTAVKYAQSILKEYPTIKGIIGISTITIAAAAQVVQQEGLCGKYVIVGTGDPKQMESYVKSGCVKQFSLWGFVREGQVAMCAMHALLTKTITGKTGDSFTCGSLGGFKVEPANTITAGPPTVFTNKNYNLYTF